MPESILSQLQRHADRLQSDLRSKQENTRSHANCPASVTDALERAVRAADALVALTQVETERNNP